MSRAQKDKSARLVLESLGRAARLAEDRRPTPAPQPDERLEDATGLTVFGGDMPLRLRNLTGERLDPLPGDPGLMPGVFKIRLARSRSHTQGAGTLIERRYASRGYQIPGLKSDPNLRTFIAYENHSIVGTLSLRLDSEKGLSADDLYRQELSQFRAAGVQLCEFTRLAVEGDTVSKPVLGALFHTAYLYAHRVRGREYGLIEVNPRHAVFYRRGLYFELIGPERMNRRVNAPSVLLCVSFGKTATELKKYFSEPEKRVGRRSLYAHWFPPDEAKGVLNRLRQLEMPYAAPAS